MKFVDLFAGIGGFHLALSQLGFECVFASEIDEYARETYRANFHISEAMFNKDIRKICPSDIPDHDLLCAGFPCQPFSQAGLKKGFLDLEDSERGNLFFCVADILKIKKPKAFILENVRHLVSHNGGKTFATICNILQDELGYSISYRILKASDFGRPQHRPRVYIVGFSNDWIEQKKAFVFPDPLPLSMTMSDVWEAKCNKKVGYTLRVGGRGSPINDRRNWDGYIVDGRVVRLGPLQGKRMMGFPDNFILSNSVAQSMKQLGNSVCVDVVYCVAKKVKEYMEKNMKNINKKSFNKGEWSEIYVFIKILTEGRLYWADESLETKGDDVKVFLLRHNAGSSVYTIAPNGILYVKTPSQTKILDLKSILPPNFADTIFGDIRSATNTTFQLPVLESLFGELDIQNFKGSSSDKGDIKVGFEYKKQTYEEQSLSIKSLVGGIPTLLNASSATNFIYKITNFSGDIHEVNSIATRAKIRERIARIGYCGGEFSFYKCESDIFQHNLNIIDSNMTAILAKMLLNYYMGRGSDISSFFVDEIEVIKIKRLLEAILLGMFASKRWDGEKDSNGLIVVRVDGKLVLYHIIKEKVLKNFLYSHAVLDTPSSTRHRFGYIYKENGELFFKLNLQIRLR